MIIKGYKIYHCNELFYLVVIIFSWIKTTLTSSQGSVSLSLFLIAVKVASNFESSIAFFSAKNRTYTILFILLMLSKTVPQYFAWQYPVVKASVLGSNSNCSRKSPSNTCVLKMNELLKKKYSVYYE